MIQLTAGQFKRLNDRLANAGKLSLKIKNIQLKLEDAFIALQILSNETNAHRKQIQKLKNR